MFILHNELNGVSVIVRHRLIHSFVDRFVRWFVGSLVRWFVGSLVRWFVGSLVRWFVGSLVRWFVGSLVGSALLPGMLAIILRCNGTMGRWLFS